MPLTPERALTPERFAQGMTFDEYVAYTATPANLARESGWWLGTVRKDLSDLLRAWYEGPARLSDPQTAAIRLLAAQPDGPARILVISEEWSSDCRRDVTMLARMAEAGGLQLRIFPRDGQRLGRGPRADPAESPNADLVNSFLREQDGQTFQSIPIAAFLHERLPLPLALRRIPRDLSQAPARGRHARRPAWREPRADVGPIHARVAGSAALAVLSDLDLGQRQRDSLGALRAGGGRI